MGWGKNSIEILIRRRTCSAFRETWSSPFLRGRITRTLRVILVHVVTVYEACWALYDVAFAWKTPFGKFSWPTGSFGPA